MSQLALELPAPGLVRTNQRSGGAYPTSPARVLLELWTRPLGDRVYIPCEPRPGCDACAEMREHECEAAP